MKNLISLVLSGLIVLNASAQKTINDANAVKRNVSGFHAIQISGGIDLYLSQGNEAVAVSATSAEHRDRIITVVEDGVLKIWHEPRSGIRIDWGNYKMRAYVSFKDLDQLRASGGSDVNVEGTIHVDKLDLHISGGSDFKGNVDVIDLSAEASGGSDIKISGRAQKMGVDVSGGSDFIGYELSADFCNVEASGGSDVYITVNKELSASASGGSDVYYKGNGLIRDLKSSGSNIKKVTR
jgi:hypothetical protein